MRWLSSTQQQDVQNATGAARWIALTVEGQDMTRMAGNARDAMAKEQLLVRDVTVAAQ